MVQWLRLQSRCRGPGFDTWSANKIPHATSKSLSATAKERACHNEDQRPLELQLRPSTAKNFHIFKKVTSNWSRVGSKSNIDWCPYKKRRDTGARRRGHVKTEAEAGAIRGRVRNEEIAGNHRKLGRGKDSPTVPSEGAWPGCQP